MRAIPLVAISFLLATAVGAQGSPGDLDPTFGTGGIATILFPGASAGALAVVTQPDGMIVAAGHANGNFALVRVTADGTLDPSFGTGGLVAVDFGGDDVAYALVRQSDGKLVAAGQRGSSDTVVVARYEEDGAPDGTFGTGGVVTTPGLDFQDVVLQPDDKLVVGGFGSSGFMLIRYDTDGNLDGTFGTGGVAATQFPPTPSGGTPTLRGLAQAPGDKILAVGGANDVVALARFDSDGALDATFGTGGQATSSPYPPAEDVVVQSDGKLVAMGTAGAIYWTPEGPVTIAAIIVMRFEASGAVDATYGTNGAVQLNDFFQPRIGRGLAIQTDDKVVVTGDRWDGMVADSFFVTRVTTAGTLDASFSGHAGTIDRSARGVVIQPDRKIVAAGVTGPVGSSAFRLVRYHGGECGNGLPDGDELCDDGNAINGDGCDDNCTPSGCGNGAVAPGEDCDPPGPCCSATCQFVPAGTVCPSDGNLCDDHRCDGAGTCDASLHTPSATCTTPPPRKSKIQLKRIGFPQTQSLKWSWKKGVVGLEDLADPTQTDYALCVYDHSAGSPYLTMQLPVPGSAGSPYWNSTSSGFDYKEKTGASSGVTRAILRANGLGKFTIKAKGPSLPTPNTPIRVDPKVTVQLRNRAGGCWGADFSVPKKNDGGTFKATSD